MKQISSLMKTPAFYLQLLTASLFILLSHYFYYAIGDDAYIYFRYVDRALIGEGWSWTSQIPPAEGYSSPLWYGLLIVFTKLGFGVEFAARLLGLSCSLVSVVLCYRLGRLFKLSDLQATIACLLLVLNTGFHYWSSAGLETSLYSLVFIWAVIAMLQLRLWVLPLALIGILRPEGAMLLLVLLVSLKVFYREKITLFQLALAALPALLWLGIRLQVYGLPLPNTFYAKATGEPIAQIYKGIFYALPFLLPWLFCWGRLAYQQWRGETKEQQRFTLVSLGAVSWLLAIVVAGGGDWMFHFRLLQPILGILLVLIVASAVASGWLGRALLFVLSLPLLSLSITPMHFSAALQGQSLVHEYYQEGELLPASKVIAEKIKQRYLTGDTANNQPLVIAVNHAGMVPFILKNQQFIDMVGLNDAHIAQAKGNVHKKFDMDYVLGAKPDLIILNSRTKPGTGGQYYHKGYWSGENALVDKPLFKKHYRPAGIEAHWQWQLIFPYHLFVQDGEYDHAWMMVYERIKS